MGALPASGETLAGRYRIGERAGAGGFAVAHEAVDTETGDRVAVKYPNYDSSNDRAVVERYFGIEADLLDRIEAAGGHPNVMSLLDRGTVGPAGDAGDGGGGDGTPYLVVEFVDGYELDEAIDRTGPLPAEEVRTVGIALCRAMSFLHGNEIVYRDLKPDNVMLTEREGAVTPILIDFNTATATGEGSETTILGPYKPREVADAGRSETRQGPWSDVYSIGKILLFLLRGAVPDKDGIDPRAFGADTPAYLAEIVEKATQADHRERYRNATAMARVLEDRDASPPPSATLLRQGGGERYDVYPGDSLGRRDATGPDPSIAIRDDEEYVSTVQVEFDLVDGVWRLQDRSLNGTYVQTGDGWQRVLGAAGRERLEAQGEDPTDRHGFRPPETYDLADGALIALVHPSYGLTFEFRT
jgi:protein kinase/serine/threonine-protein kinase